MLLLPIRPLHACYQVPGVSEEYGAVVVRHPEARHQEPLHQR